MIRRGGRPAFADRTSSKDGLKRVCGTLSSSAGFWMDGGSANLFPRPILLGRHRDPGCFWLGGLLKERPSIETPKRRKEEHIELRKTDETVEELDETGQ